MEGGVAAIKGQREGVAEKARDGLVVDGARSVFVCYIRESVYRLIIIPFWSAPPYSLK